MSKIEELKEYLKPKDETWIYEDGDEITQEELELIRNATTKQKMNLFKKNETGHPFEYNVKFLCRRCRKNVIEKWNKTQILDKNKKLLCEECVNKEKHEKEVLRKEEGQEYEEMRRRKTISYIDRYLDPIREWNDGVKQWEKWKDISVWGLDEDLIANEIRSLEYNTFLMTPYWKAVSGQVKKRNDYKCQLCGKQGTLNVHHSDYSIHGYEVQNINKLLCLCNDCHNNFHKITNKSL